MNFSTKTKKNVQKKIFIFDISTVKKKQSSDKSTNNKKKTIFHRYYLNN